MLQARGARRKRALSYKMTTMPVRIRCTPKSLKEVMKGKGEEITDVKIQKGPRDWRARKLQLLGKEKVANETLSI